MTSCRFALSCSIRSGRLIASGLGTGVFFMRRENCAKRFGCQRRFCQLKAKALEVSAYFSEGAALVASPGATMGWRKGIMARSFGPNCSTGMVFVLGPVATKIGQHFSV